MRSRWISDQPRPNVSLRDSIETDPAQGRPVCDHARMTSARPQSPIERISAPVLLRLHALPRWAFPAFTAVLLVGGLVTTNVVISTMSFGLLTLFLGWLIALSWQILPWSARLMRLAVIGSLIFLCIDRLTA